MSTHIEPVLYGNKTDQQTHSWTELRQVNSVALVDESMCTGCHICERICPTLSIRVGADFLAHVEEENCAGCSACADRCPEYCISLQDRKEIKLLRVDPKDFPQDKIREICVKAHHHPKEVICYCTGTRAEEIVAAILKGAASPEDLSRMTGMRTGCKVECIQPALRLLKAAGIEPKKPIGYQWYGITRTLWDLPKELLEKKEYEKFYFLKDKEFLERIVSSVGEPK
jgi:Pyruvate/2-oxoacid:ferredoxin oxidoreductase delta subunit/bacterioferritin-associated ferredoxin